MTSREPSDIPTPALWLDASSPCLTVALWSAKGFLDQQPLPSLRTQPVPAARGVFSLTTQLLASEGLELRDLRSILFVEGPGSALGLRVVVMALRVWATLPTGHELRFFSAYSTDVLAASLTSCTTHTAYTVAVPQGRLAWSLHERNADGTSATAEPRKVPVMEAFSTPGRLLFPANHKLWDVPPPSFEPVHLDQLATVQALAAGKISLRETTLPEVFPREAPTFRKLGEPASPTKS